MSETKRGIVPFDAEELSMAKDMATTFAASGFFSDAKGVAQAFVKIVAGAEFGMSPFQAMAGLHVIEGRVELSANLMAAKVKSSGKYDYRVRENSTESCRIEFFQREGGKWESLGSSEFTLAQAKATGLCMGRQGMKQNWKTFPAAMLFARALSQGVRMFCPDAVSSGTPVYHVGEISGREVDPDGNPLQPAEATVRAPKAGGRRVTTTTEDSSRIADMLSASTREATAPPPPDGNEEPPSGDSQAATEQPSPSEDTRRPASEGDSSPKRKADILAELDSMLYDVPEDEYERLLKSQGLPDGKAETLEKLSRDALLRIHTATAKVLEGVVG